MTGNHRYGTGIQENEKKNYELSPKGHICSQTDSQMITPKTDT